MLITLITLSWLLSLIFMFLKHPLSLGFILLLQTVMISLSTGLLSTNYWFSYILFLIMVGGMLILFIYMTSIASNEKFKFSSNIFFMACASILAYTTILFSDKFLTYVETFNFNYNQLDTDMSLNKFMNLPNMTIIILLMIYLLLTLIAIVKITKTKKGPLRQTNL